VARAHLLLRNIAYWREAQPPGRRAQPAGEVGTVQTRSADEIAPASSAILTDPDAEAAVDAAAGSLSSDVEAGGANFIGGSRFRSSFRHLGRSPPHLLERCATSSAASDPIGNQADVSLRGIEGRCARTAYQGIVVLTPFSEGWT